MIKKFIPHLFTLGNLFCGSVATVLAVQNRLVFAALFVGLGIFLDFFDGFLARRLRVSGELGKQLDSLADLVTSGLVPGIVMVQLLLQSMGGESLGIIHGTELNPVFYKGFPGWALLGLLITLSSAYRLAKFNIDERQTDSFIGLPTPANAILILSLPLIQTYQISPRISYVLFNHWFLIALTFFSSFLLNVGLPLFSLKFKTWDFKTNWYRYVFLGIAVAALLSLQFMALPIIILIYVLFSVAFYYWHWE